jgi:sugar/nucleoside kinase (ribokinase family)
MTLVVLGDLMVDVVAQVDEPIARGGDTPARISVSGGGSAANVAAWAAALGAPVALVCNVGDDERGRTAIAELEGVDVHARVDPERPTGTCVVLVAPGGERTMLSDPGANDAPLPEIPLGDHLHVAGYALVRDGPRASALRAIERARAAGMTVSVDPSPLVRPDAIPPVDLLLPNEREAEGLEGEMVVKLGARGARWGDLHVPAEPVEVVDTTGAGDAFAAGYVLAALGGAPAAAAAAAGIAAAGRTLRVTGARLDSGPGSRR